MKYYLMRYSYVIDVVAVAMWCLLLAGVLGYGPLSIRVLFGYALVGWPAFALIVAVSLVKYAKDALKEKL